MFHQAYDDVSSFRNFRFLRMDIATLGVTKKTEPFRFLRRDEQVERSLIRFAKLATQVVRIVLRIFLQRKQFEKIILGKAIQAAAAELLQYGTESMEINGAKD